MLKVLLKTQEPYPHLQNKNAKRSTIVENKGHDEEMDDGELEQEQVGNIDVSNEKSKRDSFLWIPMMTKR